MVEHDGGDLAALAGAQHPAAAEPDGRREHLVVVGNESGVDLFALLFGATVNGLPARADAVVPVGSGWRLSLRLAASAPGWLSRPQEEYVGDVLD